MKAAGEVVDPFLQSNEIGPTSENFDWVGHIASIKSRLGDLHHVVFIIRVTEKNEACAVEGLGVGPFLVPRTESPISVATDKEKVIDREKRRGIGTSD